MVAYFDGNVVGTRSLAGDTLHHNYVSVCGRRVLSSDKFLDGELSDFVVYNTGLTSTAAKDYHHGIVPTSSLLLWGRMDEIGYGSGLIDSSGNGNTGTAQGGATPLEDLVSVVITGEASNGSLFNHLNGNVTYTPDAGFTGTDTFTYKVRDNEYALSNEALVTITVTPGVSNTAPVAVDDPMGETIGDSAVLLDLTANDMDVDGSLNRHVVDLDGVDGVITWKNLGLNGTSQVSKFIRFRTTDTNAVLFDVELGPAEGGLVIQNGMLQLRCFFQTNSLQKIDMVSTGLAANGEWHSAGFTYNGVELVAYFDGNVVGTRSLAGDTLHHNYVSVCGRRVLSSDKFLDGELSDFVVYNTGLTSTAAKDYHHGIVPTSSLLLWGRMDETGYGSGLIDSSGNGNTGTALGGATPLEDLVSVVITGEASNGSLFNHLDGTVTYTPDLGFTGTDTFTYKVRDDEYALSNEAVVTIEVVSNGGMSMVNQSQVSPIDDVDWASAGLVASSVPNSVTVYEDAEDGTIDGWTAYEGGHISNIKDAIGNKIIVTQGDISDSFRLGLNSDENWNNQTEFIYYLALFGKDDVVFYFRVATSEGEKYLCYQGGSGGLEINDNVICFDLEFESEERWHSVSRDLEADLNAALPGTGLLSVLDFYVFGNARLDNLNLFKAHAFQ